MAADLYFLDSSSHASKEFLFYRINDKIYNAHTLLEESFPLAKAPDANLIGITQINTNDISANELIMIKTKTGWAIASYSDDHLRLIYHFISSSSSTLSSSSPTLSSSSPTLSCSTVFDSRVILLSRFYIPNISRGPNINTENREFYYGFDGAKSYEHVYYELTSFGEPLGQYALNNLSKIQPNRAVDNILSPLSQEFSGDRNIFFGQRYNKIDNLINNKQILRSSVSPYSYHVCLPEIIVNFVTFSKLEIISVLRQGNKTKDYFPPGNIRLNLNY